MAMFNMITPENVSKINTRLYEYEMDFYQRDDSKEFPGCQLSEILDRTYDKFAIYRDDMKVNASIDIID